MAKQEPLKPLSPSPLQQLAQKAGIAAEYTDIWGGRQRTSDEVLLGLLSALHIDAEHSKSVPQRAQELDDKSWLTPLPPVQLASVNAATTRIALTLPVGQAERTLRWTLIEESGQRHNGTLVAANLDVLERRRIGDVRYARTSFTLPQTPEAGYHRFALDEPAAVMSLIVAPERCYVPDALENDARLWGVSTQLYALRSARNWGIGDFTDLRELLKICHTAGAAIVGINPLHALFPHNPVHASPYSPSSRLFLNYLYLDVEAIADFSENQAVREFVYAPDFAQRLQALRQSELVDYPAVAAVKFPVLEMLYKHFTEKHLETPEAGAEAGREVGDAAAIAKSARGKAFVAYADRSHDALERHALFEALQEHFFVSDNTIWGWPVWPKAYRDPDGAAVAAFAAGHRARIGFYKYLQWQAEIQFEAANKLSAELGLLVGLYQDLALGVDRAGAEAWADQSVYALDASAGAPPDEYTPEGQNWGLPPFDPYALRQAAYVPFIAILRHTMRHASALRIDHVMCLLRLYCIPQGGPAGAYVYYPLHELLAIVALESRRNRCMVIGEDLGTVPEEIRSALQPAGVLSYRLFHFEKEDGERLCPPSAYPRQALVAAGTHDLATLAGFWKGLDLSARSSLGLFPGPAQRAQQVLARATARSAILLALEQEGLLPAGMTADGTPPGEMSPELALAIQTFLARTPSMIMIAQLEDIGGPIEQMNLPGTTNQYPNWRRKNTLALEHLGEDPRFGALVDMLRRERGVVMRRAESDSARKSGPVIPLATYRLQFNRDFTFDDAARLVPYLAQLGISHIYASSYLKARPGSRHGYDIIDHQLFNPEIGTPAEFARLVATLRRHGMNQILDIVPNHMGIGGADNRWWLDVLENGPASEYADFFDIAWAPLKDELRGKVLLPVLGDHYGAVLDRGALKLIFDCERGEFHVAYYQHRLPIDPRQYPKILEARSDRLAARLGPDNSSVIEFQSLTTAFALLPGRAESAPEKIAVRSRDKELHKKRLAALCAESSAIATLIEENVAALNGNPDQPDSFRELHELLETQSYRLAFWRVASEEINYRRFFDINDLAALRMEQPEVFRATHSLVFDLLAKGDIEGLRIDHPDGLYDPAEYYRRLQQAAPANRGNGAANGKSLYVVAEKILAVHEQLPESWALHGTSGYDFANLVNALFVDQGSESALSRTYSQFIGGERTDFDELVYVSKMRIMQGAMAGELNVLANLLNRISESSRYTRDYTLSSLRAALMEVVACFPVYRTYVTQRRVRPEDRRYIEWAIGAARKKSSATDLAIFDFVQAMLLLEFKPRADSAYRAAVTQFAMKFQQFTSPVMAKGFEDTALYIYHRLTSLNEVGGDPRRFGISLAAFHYANQQRARQWPHAMLGTSTHDSKRSEDVRARIDVLSELADEWQTRVTRWSRINRSRKGRVGGRAAPSKNAEYLLYQTLIGSWPLEEMDEAGRHNYVDRITTYMIKAARESKTNTSWLNPDEAYEDGMKRFVASVLADPQRDLFLADFVPFQQRVSRLGFYNSLSQLLLKMTVPGVPDFYQGNEVWDFSLVDPDNRRAVDYARRSALLDALGKRHGPDDGESHTESNGDAKLSLARELAANMHDGRIKLYVTEQGLKTRARFAAVFQQGDYSPLASEGPKAQHICAFSRSHEGIRIIVAVPRLIGGLIKASAQGLADGSDVQGWREVWTETVVQLPAGNGPQRYRNVFTGEPVEDEQRDINRVIRAAALFENFPLALLVGY
ncbi:MAG: malto-oligosyltrehalose synthase [Burkholderiales bacterium]|nr:malto-oligosyltrehalose synthase [Burkholderiales bacterium]